MRPGILGLSLAACAILAGAAWSGDDQEDAGGAIASVPVAEPPKVGSRCRIELNPVSTGRDVTETLHEGVVARSSAEGVGLTVTETRLTVVRRTPLARMRFLNRFFRNVGISRPAPGAAKEVWLPTATIRSLTPIPAGAASPADPRALTPKFPTSIEG
ncbi:hypothetical protein [Planctomyces sp. SH-PL62]|uniref:hypothetical protein n=1 Tax=Planctomyces sp. SH-PL62 TaxID=1636152 RepID=UPI00078D96BA|nr:hypothetical protein [Planctomyces sp. SH-PL62]AMV35993.1 hypothetical protein VT85_01015 [Planctomyces sp. SH-PL62]